MLKFPDELEDYIWGFCGTSKLDQGLKLFSGLVFKINTPYK